MAGYQSIIRSKISFTKLYWGQRETRWPRQLTPSLPGECAWNLVPVKKSSDTGTEAQQRGGSEAA